MSIDLHNTIRLGRAMPLSLVTTALFGALVLTLFGVLVVFFDFP